MGKFLNRFQIIKPVENHYWWPDKYIDKDIRPICNKEDFETKQIMLRQWPWCQFGLDLKIFAEFYFQ